MKVKDVKLFFNGIETRHSNKTGKDYSVLKLFDFDSNNGFEIFISNPERFKDYKPKNEYNFNLTISKQNELISISLDD